MQIIESKQSLDIIKAYPDPVRDKLLSLRHLILDVSRQIRSEDVLLETLKWGEPSYCTKQGSTIRINKKKTSDTQYAVYFHCQTKLVDTFKELYRDQLSFEANRAIVFDIIDEVPIDILKHCIKLSLTYHQIKHLPLLGTRPFVN